MLLQTGVAYVSIERIHSLYKVGLLGMDNVESPARRGTAINCRRYWETLGGAKPQLRSVSPHIAHLLLLYDNSRRNTGTRTSVGIRRPLVSTPRVTRNIAPNGAFRFSSYSQNEAES